jgi:hypothetical protein
LPQFILVQPEFLGSMATKSRFGERNSFQDNRDYAHLQIVSPVMTILQTQHSADGRQRQFRKISSRVVGINTDQPATRFRFSRWTSYRPSHPGQLSEYTRK